MPAPGQRPSLARHLAAILALPFMVTVVVPGLLLARFGRAGLPRAAALPLLGGILVLLGLVLAGSTIRLFATAGEGTLAPWDPPRRLVVAGVYRHVRNPMISGVVAILFGEAALAGSSALLVWAAAFFGLNALYIPLAEEPALLHRFGQDYRDYKKNVPRWIPRLRPWKGRPWPRRRPAGNGSGHR